MIIRISIWICNAITACLPDNNALVRFIRNILTVAFLSVLFVLVSVCLFAFTLYQEAEYNAGVYESRVPVYIPYALAFFLFMCVIYDVVVLTRSQRHQNNQTMEMIHTNTSYDSASNLLCLTTTVSTQNKPTRIVRINENSAYCDSDDDNNNDSFLLAKKT